MTSKPENCTAFPIPEGCASPWLGMTLRDWFAGQALAGKLASDDPGSIDQAYAVAVAQQAYWVADAMLAERALD